MEINDLTKNILFFDDSILVINKPAGLLSIIDGYNKDLPYLSQLLEPQFGPLLVVHRLDKDTSGVVILARTAEAHRSLNIQFQKKIIHKIYHAIINGVPAWQEYTANLPLLRDGDRHHRTTVNFTKGKKAETTFTIIERFYAFAYLEAKPATGYTHQIRAHLSFLGYPIVNDPLYAQLSKKIPLENEVDLHHSISRLALHAFSISFIHPTTGQPITFETPDPPDFLDSIIYLRQNQ